jgi:signal transduction histidine kinase
MSVHLIFPWRATFRRVAQAIAFVPVLCAAYCGLLAQPARILDSLTALLRSAETAHNDTLTVHALVALAEQTIPDRRSEALQYALRAVTKAEEASLTRELISAWKVTSVVHRSLGDEDAANAAMATIERLCYSTKDTAALLDVYNTTAGAYYSRGAYPPALQWWLRGLSLAEQSRNRQFISRFLNNIAHVYQAQKQYTTTLQYFRRAIAIAEKSGNTRDMALYYGNTGLVYSMMQHYDSAMDWHFRALSAAKSLSDGDLMAMVLTNIGQTHHALRHFPQALDYFRQALVLEQQVPTRLADQNVTRNAAAATCLALGKPREAIAYAQDVVRRAEPIGARPTLKDAYQILAQSYAAQGMFAEAYRYQIKLTDLKDSLLNAESVRRVAEVQGQYEVQKRQQEIALLSRQKESRSRFLYAALVALALLIALLLALWNRYRLKHRSETALQQANEMLADRNAELATLNDEKNELLGIAAHDLKNPLAAIMLSAQMSERAADKNNPERVIHHAQDVQASVYQMLEIINNILDVNKIESGAVAMHLESVDCASILAATADVYQDRAALKGITVDVRIPEVSETPEVPEAVGSAEPHSLNVLADYAALAQTLDNLVSNAVKYSPHHKRVLLAAERVGDVVQLAVQDEGPGLTDEDKQKLFHKFARLSARPTGGENSTGLGLSIVKKLVEAMNGRVWCESARGVGTTFIVELPAAPDEP